MKASIVLLGALLTTCAVPLLADTPKAQAAPATKSDDPNRMICRTEDAIGSRIKKKRICLTAAEWRDVASESGRTLERSTTHLAFPGG